MRSIMWALAHAVVAYNEWHTARMSPLAPYSEVLRRLLRVHWWRRVLTQAAAGGKGQKVRFHWCFVANLPRLQVKITVIYQ